MHSTVEEDFSTETEELIVAVTWTKQADIAHCMR